MFNIRKAVFETNSSSCHCFVYERDLAIPKEIHIDTKDTDYRNLLGLYYENYKDDFIAWLHRIGVERIYIDEQLVDPIPELKQLPKMFNSPCESHNDDVSDEEILKYSLFGDLVMEFKDYDDNPKDRDVVRHIRQSNQLVWSDWFV